MIGCPAVLGVDLSLRATGLAWPSGSTELIVPRNKSGLARQAEVAGVVVDRARTAEIVALEGSLHHMPGSREIVEFHGAVQLRLWSNGRPTALIPPSTLKKYATGNGHATKKDMWREMRNAGGPVDVTDDNEVDAWWLRAAALDHYGWPAAQLPLEQRRLLDTVEWPEL